MVQICRHIKPSGERCKSPAMNEHSFCYFHARVHLRTTRNIKYSLHADPDKLDLPVPEDFAAIQESIAKVFDAIVNERIDHREASQILSGLRIALKTIPRNPAPPTDSVREVICPKRGEELAPPLEISPSQLESGSTKSLPVPTGDNSADAVRNLRKIENVRAEIIGGIHQGQLLIATEKVERYFDKPDNPA